MTTIIRNSTPEDLPGLLTLQQLCHPTWPAYPDAWWFTHPTLTLTDGPQVIGSTSFTVSTATDREFLTRGAELAYGHGLNVHPDSRGRRLGWRLFEARHDILRECGVRFFIGMTQPGNQAMLHIFEKYGLTFHDRIAGYYPDGVDGLMYVGDL